MRRPISKLIALCLLLLVIVTPPKPAPSPVASLATSASVAFFDWSNREASNLNARKHRELSYLFSQSVSQPTRRKYAAKVVYGSGACGGDLPPCSVLACESGGNLVAQNSHSSASGKWQFLDSTWAGYGGYERAMYAPESVQDDKARIVWNGGKGASQWVCH